MLRLFLSIFLAGAAVLVGAAVGGEAGDKVKKDKQVAYYCPVAGMPEVKTCGCPAAGYCPRRPCSDMTVAYRGGKVQLCCPACEKLFKESPAKFATVANHQLVATKQAKQVKCAMCGSAIGYLPGIDVAGITLSFCSYDCYNNLKKLSPTERVTRVFGDEGFKRGFAMAIEKK